MTNLWQTQWRNETRKTPSPLPLSPFFYNDFDILIESMRHLHDSHRKNIPSLGSECDTLLATTFTSQQTFTCLKSTIKTPMSTFSSVFVVDFGQLNVFWVSVFTPFAEVYLAHDILYTTVLSVVLFSVKKMWGECLVHPHPRKSFSC